MKKTLNRPIKILLGTNSLILVSGAMLAPIYALYVREIGGDLLDASITGGVFAVAAGITSLIAGKHVDKIKENELVVVFGYVGMGLGFLLYAAVGAIWQLLLVQVLIGFSEAFYSPAFDALYSRHLNRKKAGTTWGLWEAINYYMTALGAVIGGAVAYFFGFKPIFILMSILSLASALYIYRLPRKVL